MNHFNQISDIKTLIKDIEAVHGRIQLINEELLSNDYESSTQIRCIFYNDSFYIDPDLVKQLLHNQLNRLEVQYNNLLTELRKAAEFYETLRFDV